MPKNKPDVGHYARGRIEPIDFMEGSFLPDEYRGFLKGNVIKYVSRYRHKGTPLGDLTKARIYLDWLIEFENKHKGESQ